MHAMQLMRKSECVVPQHTVLAALAMNVPCVIILKPYNLPVQINLPAEGDVGSTELSQTF